MSKNAFAAAVLGTGLCWSCAAAFAGEAEWKTHMGAGAEAQQRGDHPSAAARFEDALKEAQAFDEGDARLALTLDKLAELYRLQGRDADAEPLVRRARAVREKAPGRQNPDVTSAPALPVSSSAPEPEETDPGPPPKEEGMLDGAVGGVKRLFDGILKVVPGF